MMTMRTVVASLVLLLDVGGFQLGLLVRRSPPLQMSTMYGDPVTEKAPKPPTPEEIEKTLLTTITGSPILGVSGLFEEATRTDQFVLDCVHAQKVWGSIVALAAETSAAKKQLTSRSARYSGLLDALTLEALPADKSANSLASCLASSGAKAWLAFGVDKNDVEKFVEAAKQHNFERLVVATIGNSQEVTVKGGESDDFTWTAIDFEVDSLNDEAKEGGPIAINKIERTMNFTALGVSADEEEYKPSIARADAYRLVAESFLMKSAQNKILKVSDGGPVSAKYLRHLRSAGYTRRGELAKMVGGGLDEFIDQVEAEEKKKYEDNLETVFQTEEEREKDIAERMAEINANYEQERLDAVAEKARDVLARRWETYKYSSARMFTKEQYVFKHNLFFNNPFQVHAHLLGRGHDRGRGHPRLQDHPGDARTRLRETPRRGTQRGRGRGRGRRRRLTPHFSKRQTFYNKQLFSVVLLPSFFSTTTTK